MTTNYYYVADCFYFLLISTAIKNVNTVVSKRPYIVSRAIPSLIVKIINIVSGKMVFYDNIKIKRIIIRIKKTKIC